MKAVYRNPAGIWLVWLALILALTLSACGTLFPQVEGARDGVAVSYASIESGAEVTSSLLRSGTIDAEEARFVQAILERAYALTRIAERETLAGKPDTAQEILERVSSLLTDIEQFLGRKF